VVKAHERLQKIRERTDLKARPTPHLKKTFTDFDGVEKPLKVRYYQIQMMLHMVICPRFVNGDDTGLGKSLETIIALCYLWEKQPDLKAVVFTTKSATKQWVKEFAKFTTGIRVFMCKGTPAKRSAVRKKFEAATEPSVMVMGYAAARKDFSHIHEWEGMVLVFDECTVFKNPNTQIHRICKHLSLRAARSWGLTATLIKNTLVEGYGIYQVIMPGLFKMSLTAFTLYYCIVRMQAIPRSTRKIPIIIGYARDKIREFRKVIDFAYLGRAKHEVASELPSITPRTIEVDLSPAQLDKYKEALTKVLMVGDDAHEMTQLTRITYCQEIVDHMELVEEEGGSEKMDILLDLLSNGDLSSENVIVFSRFRRMIDIIMLALKKAKIPAVRVTGAETDEDVRDAAMSAFQDPKNPARVICVTTAGSDAINLQAARAIICYDTPWSAGDYLQLLGRMVRIGSLHDRCFAIHLAARDSVDFRVLEVLKKKMRLIEAVLGRRIQGEDPDADFTIPVENDVRSIFNGLRKDAKAA